MQISETFEVHKKEYTPESLHYHPFQMVIGQKTHGKQGVYKPLKPGDAGRDMSSPDQPLLHSAPKVKPVRRKKMQSHASEQVLLACGRAFRDEPRGFTDGYVFREESPGRELLQVLLQQTDGQNKT